VASLRAPRKVVKVMMHSGPKAKFAGLAGLLMSLALVSQPAASKQAAKAGQRNLGQEPPAVYGLYKTETIDFPSSAPAAVESAIKCGPNGDIYAVYSSDQAQDIGKQPVSRISASSKGVTEYPTPAMPGYSAPGRGSFDVRADGTLYALVLATARSGAGGKARRVSFIVKYNEDGTVDSRIRVGGENGTRIQPLRIAAFGDGDFLLSGTTALTRGEIAKGARLRTFAGIFGRAGTFLSPIKLMEPTVPAKPSPPPRANASAPGVETHSYAAEMASEDENAVSLGSHTLSVSSADGNVYVLQGAYRPHLYVISSTGDITRQVRLKPPAKGISPIQMAAAGSGYLFIYYGHVAAGVPGENPHQRGMITVLNQETGRVTAVYRMPEAQAGFAVPACADSSDDFLFLGASKDNHLAVVRYAAR